MDLTAKKITVLGARETGVQTALFLKKRGADVFVSELKEASLLPESRKTLREQGIECEFGEHSWDQIEDSGLVILSPGIPPQAPIYQKVIRAGIPVWSEIELAFRASPSELIAVTGTSGKTTVTTLIRDVLRQGGRPAISCGNIGNSFIREVEHLNPGTIAVVEVSSFQLMHIEAFRPHVAVLLNLSANHLDWHGSFDRYAEAKCRIFKNQTDRDFAIIKASDFETLKWLKDIRSRVIHFDGQGPDNPNYAAVREVASRYQIDPKVTDSVLENFSGLEHRFEEVGTFFGVRYINDSKSTTIASLGWALDRVGESCVLIAGGRHKGGDFRLLRDIVRRKVTFLIVLGEAEKEIESAFSDVVSVYSVSTLEEGLRVARTVSRAGQTVLFSPACASFDMFQDYQDRGRKFKTILASWREEELASAPNR